jgi:hypothetical protein
LQLLSLQLSAGLAVEVEIPDGPLLAVPKSRH